MGNSKKLPVSRCCCDAYILYSELMLQFFPCKIGTRGDIVDSSFVFCIVVEVLTILLQKPSEFVPIWIPVGCLCDEKTN